ncbi:MAG: hypothetical protein CMN30_33760 [Sandaracinus sp.]|nr:hypothetical protein [Sandaracinus sp.]
MSPSVRHLALLAVLSAACGTQATSVALEDPHDDPYAVAMIEAYDAYETSLSAAAERTYETREAARSEAERLGREAELLGHIDTALAAHGLVAGDLAWHSHDHPGFVEWQSAVYTAREPRFDALRQAIARAPVTPDIQWGDLLDDPTAPLPEALAPRASRTPTSSPRVATR